MAYEMNTDLVYRLWKQLCVKLFRDNHSANITTNKVKMTNIIIQIYSSWIHLIFTV